MSDKTDDEAVREIEEQAEEAIEDARQAIREVEEDWERWVKDASDP